MTNKRNGTLYVGVTTDLLQRVYQHKEGLLDGFTKRYGCNLLVYYELYPSIIAAISREKQLKAGSRMKKIALINAFNPTWLDLYDRI